MLAILSLWIMAEIWAAGNSRNYYTLTIEMIPNFYVKNGNKKSSIPETKSR